MGYIYKITNTVNDKVYIGQTTKTAKARFTEHKYHATHPRVKTCRHLHSAMAKYGCDKFSIEVIEECPKEQLDEREIYWIKEYDAYTNGYNLTVGGVGTRRKKDTATMLALWRDGFSTSDIARKLKVDRETVSIELKAQGITDAEIKDQCYKVVSKKNRNPVYQYDLQGNFIREFSSIYEAEQVLGINRHCIRGALNGQHQVAGEYQWRTYKTENIGAETRKYKTTPKKVYCFETDMVYRSISEAGKAVGIDRHIVKRYIDGKRKDEKYHFKFV